MRKFKFLCLFVMVLSLVCLGGCGDSGDVKIYKNTEEVEITHDEQSMTAVITKMDMENNLISFVATGDGSEHQLIYHGGVSVLNTRDKDIGIEGVNLGSVVDVVYYADTSKLVSIKLSTKATVLTGVKKFAANKEKKTATYGGVSCELSDYVVAYDGDEKITVSDVNTEDEVTLNLCGNKLQSVAITKGHGYVRLLNQATYIGGFAEMGKDVIVPVTEDMLVAVGEGTYTLRLMKGGYTGEKTIIVSRNHETVVDVSDLAIPTGTVSFSVNPEDAEVTIYVDGNNINGKVYSGLYGSHKLKVEAEGYATFIGSFEIKQASKTLKISLRNSGDSDDDDKTTEENSSTTSTDENGTTEASTTGTTTTESGSTETTEQTTTSSTSEELKNTITIKGPSGVGVYMDGDYVGIAPVTFTKTVGTHTVTLYKAGYLIKSYTIQSEDDGKDDEFTYPDLVPLTSVLE